MLKAWSTIEVLVVEAVPVAFCGSVWFDARDFFRTDLDDEKEFFFKVAKWESRDDVVEEFEDGVYMWAENAREFDLPAPSDR